MSADDYAAVLKKLQAEISFLNSVYLYLWGEPLLCPDLPEIIRITGEYGIATEISTNLIVKKEILERVVKARPDFLVDKNTIQLEPATSAL